jgi:rhodanese-related sulfurtransferase
MAAREPGVNVAGPSSRAGARRLPRRDRAGDAGEAGSTGRSITIRYHFRFARTSPMSYLAFLQKNWILVFTLLVSGGMLLWPLITQRLHGGREINTLGVTQLINSANPLLLDIRETREFEGGSLPNAIHVPLSQLGSRGAELAKYVSRPVVAVCDRGVRSRSAVGALAKLGFKDIFYLRGGIKAWRDAGLPLQRT